MEDSRMKIARRKRNLDEDEDSSMDLGISDRRFSSRLIINHAKKCPRCSQYLGVVNDEDLKKIVIQCVEEEQLREAEKRKLASQKRRRALETGKKIKETERYLDNLGVSSEDTSLVKWKSTPVFIPSSKEDIEFRMERPAGQLFRGFLSENKSAITLPYGNKDDEMDEIDKIFSRLTLPKGGEYGRRRRKSKKSKKSKKSTKKSTKKKSKKKSKKSTKKSTKKKSRKIR